jgi:hypothetical protein
MKIETSGMECLDQFEQKRLRWKFSYVSPSLPAVFAFQCEFRTAGGSGGLFMIVHSTT